MPTDPASICLECGAELPAGTVPGQCPNCLLGLGLTAAKDGDRRSEDGGHRSRVTHHAPLAPDFGDYELLEEIGHGGMGVVYKARQKSLDRIVALKLLLFGPHAPPESVKRFRAEAVATAALQHPNIVAIHEVGVHQGQHFLVMDFVDGPSLAGLIGNQPLPAKRAASYVKTISEAIHYAHERGLLHRDLKPSNILIDANDQPRVTDFGLAKRIEGDSELTVSGQMLGSPNYMPPEQATGKRGTVSRRSDVYALGAILYHALTGRPPFVGEGLAETVQQVLNVEPVSPHALNPRLPADLETVCLRCLEKEPGKRYATAQMLAEELGRFLEDKPVLARRVGWLDKAWRWCWRNPRLASATGTALLSLLIGLAGVTLQWRRAESQRARAEAEANLARRNAYAADMKGVQRALEESDLVTALEFLNRHRPAGKAESRKQKAEIDLRGWEWRYLWARCRSDERFTLCQYSNSVSALAFSPDGSRLAVGRKDGVVTLWDAVARRPMSETRGGGYCEALVLSRQGNLMAWSKKDAGSLPVVNVRDLSALKETGLFRLSDQLVSAAFSPDATAIVTLAFDGTVTVWDIASQRAITNLATATADVTAEQYSTAVKVTATSAADGAVGRQEPGLPQVQTGSQRRRFYSQHKGCVLFSPDGQWLAIGEGQPRIRLWDWTTHKEKKHMALPVAANGINALAFSPDSKLLAAGCGFGDNDVHVWDLAAATDVRLVGHNGWVVGLAFSPDGQTLASASADQTVRLWNVGRKTEVRRLQGDTAEVSAIAWSPDGKSLVTSGEDGSVRYWDPEANRAEPYAVLRSTIWSWGLAFLPDSKTFLTLTRPEGAVVRWDAASLQELESLGFLGTNHSSLDLSRDGRRLALGDANGNVRVWDFPARRLVTNLVFPEAWIFAVVFSPQGGHLHCGALSPDGRLVTKFWEAAFWREVNLQGINLKNLREVDFSPNERTVALGYQNGTAAWWDIVTGTRQAFFDCRCESGVRVRFSPDGRCFATAGMNGVITLWDVLTQQAMPIGRGYRGGLHDLVFSPDGRRLITTGASPKDLVKLWDVETGRDVATLPGEPGLFFHHIGCSPDGNMLFADSFQGVAVLWRAPSWEEIEAKEREQRAP